MSGSQPNILFFHVDNLGFGELSCCSGGPFRGCSTERIDAFAAKGFRLTNYCPESRCTPTRSALLTGRYSIRSGTHSVPIGRAGGRGLVAWEKTLGDVLSEAGYGCAVYGKLLDLLDSLNVAADTLVVFAGDNGPEEVLLWRGTPGYWDGSRPPTSTSSSPTFGPASDRSHSSHMALPSIMSQGHPANPANGDSPHGHYPE